MKTAQEVTELSSSVARLEKVVDTLVKRQDSSEQAMREALLYKQLTSLTELNV